MIYESVFLLNLKDMDFQVSQYLFGVLNKNKLVFHFKFRFSSYIQRSTIEQFRTPN